MIRSLVRRFIRPIILVVSGIVAGSIGFEILIANFCMSNCPESDLLNPLAFLLLLASPLAILVALYWAVWITKYRVRGLILLTALLGLLVTYYFYHSQQQLLLEQQSIECLQNLPVGAATANCP